MKTMACDVSQKLTFAIKEEPIEPDEIDAQGENEYNFNLINYMKEEPNDLECYSTMENYKLGGDVKKEYNSLMIPDREKISTNFGFNPDEEVVNLSADGAHISQTKTETTREFDYYDNAGIANFQNERILCESSKVVVVNENGDVETREDLVYHVRKIVVTDDKPTFGCEHCGEMFYAREECAAHVEGHVILGHCDESVLLKSERNQFKFEVSECDITKCNQCDKIFANSQFLSYHEEYCVIDDAGEFTDARIKEETLKKYLDTCYEECVTNANISGERNCVCMFCEKEVLPRRLRKHIRKHFHDETKVCEPGEYRSSFARTGRRARESGIRIDERQNEEILIRCEFCRKKYYSQDYLNAHIRKHHKNVKEVIAEYRNRIFTPEGEIVDELNPDVANNCDETIAFKCELCLKKFIHSAHLINHLKKIHMKILNEETNTIDLMLNKSLEMYTESRKSHLANSNRKIHPSIRRRQGVFPRKNKKQIVFPKGKRGKRDFYNCDVCCKKIATYEKLVAHAKLRHNLDLNMTCNPTINLTNVTSEANALKRKSFPTSEYLPIKRLRDEDSQKKGEMFPCDEASRKQDDLFPCDKGSQEQDDTFFYDKVLRVQEKIYPCDEDSQKQDDIVFYNNDSHKENKLFLCDKDSHLQGETFRCDKNSQIHEEIYPCDEDSLRQDDIVFYNNGSHKENKLFLCDKDSHLQGETFRRDKNSQKQEETLLNNNNSPKQKKESTIEKESNTQEAETFPSDNYKRKKLFLCNNDSQEGQIIPRDNDSQKLKVTFMCDKCKRIYHSAKKYASHKRKRHKSESDDTSFRVFDNSYNIPNANWSADIIVNEQNIEEIDVDLEEKCNFNIGDKVFAKLKGYPYWPAKVTQVIGNVKFKYALLFYGTHKSGICKERRMLKFEDYRDKILANEKTVEGIRKAILEADIDASAKPRISNTGVAPRDDSRSINAITSTASFKSGYINGMKSKHGGHTGSNNGTKSKHSGYSSVINGIMSKHSGYPISNNGTESKHSGYSSVINGIKSKHSGYSSVINGITSEHSGHPSSNNGSESKHSGYSSVINGIMNKHSGHPGNNNGTKSKHSVHSSVTNEITSKHSGYSRVTDGIKSKHSNESIYINGKKSKHSDSSNIMNVTISKGSSDVKSPHVENELVAYDPDVRNTSPYIGLALYGCRHCENRYFNKRDLEVHHKTKHKLGNRIKCKVCNRELSKHYLKSHMRRHTREVTMECHFCGKYCYARKDMASHLKHQHTPDVVRWAMCKYKCQYCEKAFERMRYLISHIAKNHSVEETQNAGSPIENQLVTYKGPPVVKQLIARNGSPVENQLVTCNGSSVENKSVLRNGPSVENQLVSHNWPSVENKSVLHNGPSVENQFVSHNRPSVENQLVLHNGPSVENQLVLRNGPSVESQLVAYKPVIHDISPYVGILRYGCRFCKNRYANKYELEAHYKKLHGASKRIKCEVCDKELCKSSLKNHMSRHTREIVMECHFCGKNCYTRGDMVSHLEHRHTPQEVKWAMYGYKCKYCERAFERARALHAHVKTTHLTLVAAKETPNITRTTNVFDTPWTVATRNQGMESDGVNTTYYENKTIYHSQTTYI